MKFTFQLFTVLFVLLICTAAETSLRGVDRNRTVQAPGHEVDSHELLEIKVTSVKIAPEVKGRRKWRVDFEFVPSEGKVRVGRGFLFIHSPIIELKQNADQLVGQTLKIRLKTPYVEGYKGYLEVAQD